MDKTTQDLFESVYQAPDEDGPREALAQKLIEEGDPRGEFIQLQLARARGDKLSRDAQTRERTLLKEYGKEWLSPLNNTVVLRSVRWDRGFPVAASLNYGKTKEDLEHPIGCTALATLRTLDLEKGNTIYPNDFYERLFAETPLKGLRVLRGLPGVFLLDFVRSPIPWALKSVNCPNLGIPRQRKSEEQFSVQLCEAFSNGKGLPDLSELTLSFVHLYQKPEAHAWLWETPPGRRIRVLRVCARPYVLRDWLPRLNVVSDRIALEQLDVFASNSYSLHRTELGWTRLTGSIDPKDHPELERRFIRETLDALGTALTEVEISGL